MNSAGGPDWPCTWKKPDMPVIMLAIACFGFDLATWQEFGPWWALIPAGTELLALWITALRA
jgi:hypothetical protein